MNGAVVVLYIRDNNKKEQVMKHLLNFEIQIYKTIRSTYTQEPCGTLDELYKTRFIFADGETIFSPDHFCQKLISRGVHAVSIVRNGGALSLPESAFEFEKICFLETVYKNKQSIWTIERVWHNGCWYVTYQEASALKRKLYYKVYRSDMAIRQCVSRLRNAIHNAENLCRTIDHSRFLDDFQKSESMLRDTNDLDKLLDGAVSACVFSGMGSWNDEVAAICEQDNILKYDEITNELFSAILDLICNICTFDNKTTILK